MGTSLMSRRMGLGVSDSLGGAFPNKVYATLEIRACSMNPVHPCKEVIYSNSRVHGNMTLYVEARSYHYKLYLYTCWFRVFFLAGMSRRDLGGMVNLYNLLLYNVAATSAALLFLSCYYNCWLFLFSCCKTRVKMLV